MAACISVYIDTGNKVCIAVSSYTSIISLETQIFLLFYILKTYFHAQTLQTTNTVLLLPILLGRDAGDFAGLWNIGREAESLKNTVKYDTLPLGSLVG